jgi:hypothetical protein
MIGRNIILSIAFHGDLDFAIKMDRYRGTQISLK